MISRPRFIKKLVRLMTDPIPEFVSLVSNAANQTPFRVVKAEDVALLNGSETTRPDGTFTDNPYMIGKMEFNKELFTNQESVLKYLSDLNYSRSDFNLNESINSFTAVSRVFNSNDENLAIIEGNIPGVTIFVGEIKLAETDQVNKSINQEELNNVKNKTLIIKGDTPEQVVSKFDSWNAAWSNETDLMQALNDGMGDGLPPGAMDVASGFWAAVANSLKANDETAVKKACSDLGDLFVKLNSIFSGAVQKSNLTHEQFVEKAFLRGSQFPTESNEASQVINKSEASTEAGDSNSDNSSADVEGDSNAAIELPSVESSENDEATAVAKTEDSTEAGEAAPSSDEVTEENTTVAQTEGEDSETVIAETPLENEAQEVVSAEQPKEDLLASIKLMLEETLEPRLKTIEQGMQDTAQKVEKLQGSAGERRSLDADETDSVSKQSEPQLPKSQSRANKSMSEVFMRGALGF